MRLLAGWAVLGALLLNGCTLLSGCAAAPTDPLATPRLTATPAPSAMPEADRDAMIADLEAAVQVTDGFWAAHWSDFFPGAYSSPTVVGLYDGSDEAGAPECDGRALAADNAYYCPQQDFVAWDVGIVSSGYAIGHAWAYLVVAHEWGHAIQSRLGLPPVSEHSEIQADCLAGATLFGAAADGAFLFDESDQAEIASGFDALAFESAHTDHGDPSERIESFDRGRRDGVSACLPTG